MITNINEVYFATPRSGSHSICSMSETKLQLLEFMSVEDMILPRNKQGDTLLYEHISTEALEHLDNGKFAEAWQAQHAISSTLSNVFYKHSDNFTSVLKSDYPTLDSFTNEQQHRLQQLQELDCSWSVKIMKYHYLDSNILTELLSNTNTIYFIKRNDLVAQSISILKAHYLTTNNWHSSTGTAIELDMLNFPYDQIVDQIENIIQENMYISDCIADYKDKVKTIYYEDVDFRTSKYMKLNINVPQLNLNKCYKLAKDAGHDYSRFNV